MENITVETQDIVLAASLKVLGFKLNKIEKEGNRGTFFFEKVQPIIVNDYHLGNVRVEPGAFNSAIKSLTTAARRMV